MTKPANTTDTEGDQLRAFVERIMRMREEAKAINDDIREIYAEAKANGFDKTVLGKVVLYVEKRSKDASAVQESDALFDLYLEAFDGRSSHAHARAREIIEEFPSADPTHVAADQSTGNVDGSAGRSHSARNLSTESPASVPVDTNTPEASGTAREAPGGSAPSDGIADLSQPVEDQLRDGEPVAGSADLRAAQDGAQHAPHTHLQHDAGDRADTDPHSLVGSSNSNLQDDLGDQAGAAAAGLSNIGAAPNKRRPYCRMPGACTGFGDKHCFTCDMRRDSFKPVGLSIGAADIPHHGAVG